MTGGIAEGAQPLHDPWGGCLVFNGEIYEHRELLRRRKVEASPLASDGLALAAVLAHEGPSGLAGVRGMFAAARYDAQTRKLLLVRDALGKKPLYLRRIRNGWVFASTLAALHAGSGPMELRPDAMHEYLLFRSVGGCHSSYRDVEQLPPGSWLELGMDGSQRKGRWWEPPAECDLESLSPPQVQELVDAAVRARRRPDGEVALFLSGGLDSSIVAASLRRQCPEQQVRVLSVGYDVEGHEDERHLARRMAQHLGLSCEEIQLPTRQVPELLADVAVLTEDPIQDPVLLPTLLLARSAVRSTKVVLTGDGSDEVWGGYARFDSVPDSLEEYLPRTLIFQPEELGLPGLPESYRQDVPLPPPGLAPLDRVLRLEVSNRLRNYHLARVDKLTMGAGLEARCPFLDVQVVTTGLRVPSSHKRPGGRVKGLLSAAFSRDLPGWLLERRKQPFSVPIRAWLAGPLRDFALDVLSSPNAFTRSFVDAREYLTGLQPQAPGANERAAKLWSLLQLEVWYRATSPMRQEIPCDQMMTG